METVKLIETVVKGNRADFKYEVSEGLKELFINDSSYGIEYDFDLSDIPKAIINIAFAGNIIPFIWLFDARLEINELDKNFIEGLPEVKKGYMDMFPFINFGGEIVVQKPMENTVPIIPGKSGTLFSGGVDAFTTLFRHIEEKPILISVWGADFDVSDVDGWSKVKSSIDKTARTYELEKQYIKSEFRSMLRVSENGIGKFIKDKGLEYWHDFQHGMALLTQAAIIGY
ncbi:MAG: hypothetical protein K6A23_09340, partial [Butyrivibrio sp.]|nr:hypothetical protein [Butyrivibrio sp.]